MLLFCKTQNWEGEAREAVYLSLGGTNILAFIFCETLSNMTVLADLFSLGQAYPC